MSTAREFQPVSSEQPATKEDKVLSILAPVIQGASWASEHAALRSYVFACVDIDATRTLWDEIRRLQLAKARTDTKDIAHRLGFIVLENGDGLRLTILCTRHLVIFDSHRRCLLSRSMHLSGTCPFCDAANGTATGDRTGTRPIDLDTALEGAGSGYRLCLDDMPVDQRYRLYASKATVNTICILPRRTGKDTSSGQCGRKRPHQINNLKTLIAGNHRSIRCLGACNSSKRVSGKWISPEAAQARIDRTVSGFLLDVATYSTWSDECVIVHKECGQRHWLSPQQFERFAKCLCCGGDPGPVHAWNMVPDLDAYDQYLRAVSTRELDPNRRADNETAFSKRTSKSNKEAELWVRCRHHPSRSENRKIQNTTRPRGTACCRDASAQERSKYTARYLDSLFAETEVFVDRERSKVTRDDAPISPDRPVFMICREHGAIARPYASYELARYNRDYQSPTPCLACNPKASNRLSVTGIRQYVESPLRFTTHGSKFKLLTSDREIQRQLIRAREQGVPAAQVVQLRIQSLLPSPLLELNEVIPISYRKFSKGSVGRFSLRKRVSWVHWFVMVFLRAWNIEFETEKTFPDLKSDGEVLRADLFVRKLSLVIEIDGPQHASPAFQLRTTSAEEAQRLYLDLKRRDQCKDEYFRDHPEYSLERVNAYDVRDDQVRQLSLSQSYKRAWRYCESLFQRLHGYAPASPGMDAIINAATTQEIFVRRAAAIAKIYDGHFSLVRVERLTENSSNERVILECIYGHVMSRPFATCRTHVGSTARGIPVEDHCHGCTSQRKMDDVERQAAAVGAAVVDGSVVRAMYLGSESMPLVKPLLDTDELSFFCAQSGIERLLPIGEAMRGARLANELILKQRELKTPWIRPTILNEYQLKAARYAALRHNRMIKLGEFSVVPALPAVLYSGSAPGTSKRFNTISKRIAEIRQWPFSLVTSPDQVWDNSSLVGLRHKACGQTSFYRADRLSNDLGSGTSIHCQARTCFEEATGIKLGDGATTPSRKGVKPTNAKSNLPEEVKRASRGALHVTSQPNDVRASFIVEVMRGTRKGQHLRVSSHDNWDRRQTYERIADAIDSDGAWPSRLKWV